MIGMIIVVIALAAMCAYFVAQSRCWEKIANAWLHAIDFERVKEWCKYNELSKSEKTAVIKFCIYLIESVSTEIRGYDEEENDDGETDTDNL